jgi:hypothetical protein
MIYTSIMPFNHSHLNSSNWSSFLLLLATFSLLSFGNASVNETIAQCGPNVDSAGNLNMDFSLVNCAVNMMNDPLQPITHVKHYVDQGMQLDVSVRFEFNNLVSINELENTATVDFFYRLWWQDIRWNMTKEFWDLSPPSVYYDGIELQSLTDLDDPLPYWRPDLHFIDVLEIETFASLVKLRPGEHSLVSTDNNSSDIYTSLLAQLTLLRN